MVCCTTIPTVTFMIPNVVRNMYAMKNTTMTGYGSTPGLTSRSAQLSSVVIYHREIIDWGMDEKYW